MEDLKGVFEHAFSATPFTAQLFLERKNFRFCESVLIAPHKTEVFEKSSLKRISIKTEIERMRLNVLRRDF